MSVVFNLGNQILLNKSISTSRFMEELSQFDDKWSQYNEFKPHIKREGLCVINESGLNQSGPVPCGWSRSCVRPTAGALTSLCQSCFRRCA